MGDWFGSEFIGAIVAWCESVVLAGLTILWNLLTETAFVSPDVTGLPQVQRIAATSLAIVNVVYVLAILWMAILVMIRDTVQSRYGPGELIPRLVIGLIGANLAMPLCSQIIGVANAVTGSLTSGGITSPGSMRLVHDTVFAAMTGPVSPGPAAVLFVVIGLIIAVLFAVLLVQWIVRIGVLVVAVGIAPIALAMHGTPQTEPAAKLWWRTVLGAVGTVGLQAVTLHEALAVFLDPDANLPALGLPGNAGAVMNLMIVLCLLWAIVKIPSLMRQYVTKSSPGRAGTIVRVLVMQQLTQGLSRAAGQVAAVRKPAGAGRAVGNRPAGGRRSGRWLLPADTSYGAAPFPGESGTARRAHGSAGRGAGSSPRGAGAVARTGSEHPGNRGAFPRGAAARTTPRPVDRRSPPPAARPAARRPRPAGAGPGVVGTAYPTGRRITPYTAADLAGGVDLYTQALKHRSTAAPTDEGSSS